MLQLKPLSLNLPSRTSSATSSCLSVSRLQALRNEMETKSSSERLYEALMKCDEKAACLLLSESVPKDTRFVDGRTPLMMAAASGLMIVINTLFRLRCDPNDADECGETPLHEAARCEKIDAFNFLLRNGANPTLKNSRGQTAIHTAVENRKNRILREMERNCGLFVTDSEGNMPIHQAIALGYEDTFDALCAAGMEMFLNLRNPENETPLFVAAVAGSVSIVKKLLDKGADPNVQNKQGYTAMHIAALKQNKTIFGELYTCCADTCVKNCDGLTPLALAPKSWIVDYCDSEPTLSPPPPPPLSQLPVLNLGSFPSRALTTQVNIRKRPLDTLFVSNDVTPFEVECSGHSKDIVVKAVAVPDFGTPSKKMHPDRPCGSMPNSIKKVVGSIADFSDLKPVTGIKPFNGHLHFVAYENFGNKDQKVVGFSKHTPIQLSETIHTRKIQAFNHLFTNSGVSIHHPKAAVTWGRLRQSIGQFFTRSLGLGSRGLSGSDLDYIGSRMNLGEQLTLQTLIEMHLFQSCCWEWLWSAVQLLARNPIHLILWNQGYIQGFQQRHEAESTLNAGGAESIMIRVSGTEAGTLVIGKCGKESAPQKWFRMGGADFRDPASIVGVILGAKAPHVLGANGARLPKEPLARFAPAAQPAGYVHLLD